MFENLLNSSGYVSNVLDMFRDNPWIGIAVPPLVHISYWTMGHAWYTNRKMADEVGSRLNLGVTLNSDTPVAAFGTMFWFRPRALRKLFFHEWKWEDFNPEPHHVDGGLAHVLERVICYVAQEAGYTTQQVLCSHLASWNFGMLEYKLQRLSAALPNASFGYQCKMLADWKRAGYPTHRPIQTKSRAAVGMLRALRKRFKKTLRKARRYVFRTSKPVVVGRDPRAELLASTQVERKG